MAKHRTASGRLRIVAGNWRGRRLPVPDVAGLRPTGERVRETLFNWLMLWIPGKRCLDLYAGTGALGLEALSRGAASCLFVDKHPKALRQLADNIDTLDAGTATLLPGDALERLTDIDPGSVDIVFLDPPFQAGSLGTVCRRVAESGILAPGAKVYVEAERAAGLPDLPAAWQVAKSARAGNVCYALVETDACKQDQPHYKTNKKQPTGNT